METGSRWTDDQHNGWIDRWTDGCTGRHRERKKMHSTPSGIHSLTHSFVHKYVNYTNTHAHMDGWIITLSWHLATCCPSASCQAFVRRLGLDDARPRAHDTFTSVNLSLTTWRSRHRTPDSSRQGAARDTPDDQTPPVSIAHVTHQSTARPPRLHAMLVGCLDVRQKRMAG